MALYSVSCAAFVYITLVTAAVSLSVDIFTLLSVDFKQTYVDILTCTRTFITTLVILSELRLHMKNVLPFVKRLIMFFFLICFLFVFIICFSALYSVYAYVCMHSMSVVTNLG